MCRAFSPDSFIFYISTLSCALLAARVHPELCHWKDGTSCYTCCRRCLTVQSSPNDPDSMKQILWMGPSLPPLVTHISRPRVAWQQPARPQPMRSPPSLPSSTLNFQQEEQSFQPQSFEPQPNASIVCGSAPCTLSPFWHASEVRISLHSLGVLLLVGSILGFLGGLGMACLQNCESKAQS